MSEYIYISALNHYEYCPTRCYWIYVAGEFTDNEYTVEGDIIHRNVNRTIRTVRGELIQLRRVHIYSRKYGLVGFADLVEEKGGEIYPVEYKRGRKGDWKNDKLQLCAQALCLEEMIKESQFQVIMKKENSELKILKGYIYYASSGRRTEVILDDNLRNYTIDVINKVRGLMQNALKPNPIYTTRCKGCSLYPVCLPKEQEKINKIKINWDI